MRELRMRELSERSIRPRQDLLQLREQLPPPDLGALVPGLLIDPSFCADLRVGRTGFARSRSFGWSSRSKAPARGAARYNASGGLRGDRAPNLQASAPRDALRRPVAKPRPAPSAPRPFARRRYTAARREPVGSDRQG